MKNLLTKTLFISLLFSAITSAIQADDKSVQDKVAKLYLAASARGTTGINWAEKYKKCLVFPSGCAVGLGAVYGGSYKLYHSEYLKKMPPKILKRRAIRYACLGVPSIATAATVCLGLGVMRMGHRFGRDIPRAFDTWAENSACSLNSWANSWAKNFEEKAENSAHSLDAWAKNFEEKVKNFEEKWGLK